MRAKKWIVALLTLGMLLTSLPAFAEEAIAEPAAEEYSEPAAVESPALAVEPEELTAAPVDAPMSAEGEADLASLFPEGEQEADLTQFMEPTEEVPEAPLADAAPQTAEAAPASIEELPDGTLICQPPEEYCAVDVDSDLTDGDLFAGYASRLFYGQRNVLMATTNAGVNLTGQNRTVYDTIKPGILEVAEGSRTSTEFGVPVAQLIGRTRATATELGVALAYGADGKLTSDCVNNLWAAFYRLFQVDVSRVATALWYDCTYEMYWFNRYQSGLGSQLPPVALKYDSAAGDYVVSAADDAVYMFRFSVLNEFASGTYAVDPSRIETVKTAARNAKAIVSQYKNYSDYAKLYAYAAEICHLASYNTPASKPGWDMSEQGPWKLIWVFDGDPDTTVVCEGYTQAFQYLCELSSFSGGICCYTVDGVAKESHAWNLVRMDDGKYYVVDVTWMDGAWADGAIGDLATAISNESNAGLFLVGGSGSVGGGYTVQYRTGSNTSYRTYSEKTLAAYPNSVLTVAGTKYVPTGMMNIKGSIYYFDENGHYVTGDRNISGTTYSFGSDGKLLSAGHTHVIVTDTEVASTCTEPGLTAGSHCKDCGEVFQEQEVILALGHKWGAPQYSWNGGTATAKRSCERQGCTETETETVTATSKATTATCEEKGKTTYTATFKNSAFTTQTHTVEDAALGHQWGAPTYAWTPDNLSVTATRTCARDASHVQSLTVKTTSRVTRAATCEQPGEMVYTASFYNDAFTTQTKSVQIPATGHSPVADAGYPATCTANGLTDGSHCAVCNTTLVGQQVIPATGHSPVGDPGYPATCTANGLTDGSHCATCGAILVGQQVIPATGHAPVGDPGYPATAIAEGRTDGSHCAVCGAILVAQQPIPALGYPQLALGKLKSNGTVTLSKDEIRQIVPAFAAANGLAVTGYTSSKGAVASIDGNGILTCNAEGKAKITVTTNNKRKKATITIKVVDPYKPTAIAIAQGKNALLLMGQQLQLGVGLAPETARTTLTWSTNKPKVATVDQNGLVTPQGEGSAKITVRTHNKKKATITVKVVDPNKPLGIGIAQGKAITMRPGETFQLNAGLSPATAQSALTWKTSKAKVATVDGNGLVTAYAKGKAKITVMTYNKKKATITVNVVP